MKSIVTQRFVECLETLLQDKRIASYRQFALCVGFQASNLGEIRKGKRDAPLELLRKSIEQYHLSPVYLLTGSGPLFTKSSSHEAFDVLTIVTDAQDQERIVHVPQPAQAGYTSGYRDPAFIENMPTYSLPDMRYRSGSYRSFDVSGRSMEPTIQPYDRVITRYIEPEYWQTSVKDQHVYVLVTSSEVVIKRVSNRLAEEGRLIVHSDNSFYQSYAIEYNDLKEIWVVESFMRNFDHCPIAQGIPEADAEPAPQPTSITAQPSTTAEDLEKMRELVADDFSSLM